MQLLFIQRAISFLQFLKLATLPLLRALNNGSLFFFPSPVPRARMSVLSRRSPPSIGYEGRKEEREEAQQVPSHCMTGGSLRQERRDIRASMSIRHRAYKGMWARFTFTIFWHEWDTHEVLEWKLGPLECEGGVWHLNTDCPFAFLFQQKECCKPLCLW